MQHKIVGYINFSCVDIIVMHDLLLSLFPGATHPRTHELARTLPLLLPGLVSHRSSVPMVSLFAHRHRNVHLEYCCAGA